MQDRFLISRWRLRPFQKYKYLLVFNGHIYFKRTLCHDLSSFPAGMDAPGCGGMNRLGGGESPLSSCRCTVITKKLSSRLKLPSPQVWVEAGASETWTTWETLAVLEAGWRVSLWFGNQRENTVCKLPPVKNKHNAPISLWMWLWNCAPLTNIESRQPQWHFQVEMT